MKHPPFFLAIFALFLGGGCGDNFRILNRSYAEQACVAKNGEGPASPACIDSYSTTLADENERIRPDAAACQKIYPDWMERHYKEWRECYEKKVQERWRREGAPVINPTSFKVIM